MERFNCHQFVQSDITREPKKRFMKSTFLRLLLVLSFLRSDFSQAQSSLQCADLFYTPSKLADLNILARFKTYPEFRRLRKEVQQLNSDDLQKAYGQFFNTVFTKQAIITEQRLRNLLEALPKLPVGSPLLKPYLRRIFQIYKENNISGTLLSDVLANIPVSDLVKDSEIFSFAVAALKTKSNTMSAFKLTVEIFASLLQGSHMKSEAWNHFGEIVRVASLKYNLDKETLIYVAQILHNSTQGDPNFNQNDFIALMQKQWGQKKLFKYRELDIETAMKSLRDITEESTYTKDRGLSGENDHGTYRGSFVKGFFESLMSLKPGQIWIDVGTGNFKAIRDYYLIGGLAKTIGITIENSYGSLAAYLTEKYGDLFTALIGKPFENYDVSELGKVDHITDMYAAFSYSPRPDIILQRYLSLLKVGGRIDLFFDNSRSVVWLNGVEISLASWLTTTKGVKLHMELGENTVAVSLIKTSEDFSVEPLILNDYVYGLPSRRTYVLPTANTVNQPT